jgi:hypothetical protein
MAVWVSCAGRRDGHLRVDCLDERLRRGGSASVVRDLEQVDPWQSLTEQGRVDPVLDVAHQQEPTSTDLPEQDDGHVVDAGTAVGRRGRNRSVGRPQHAQRDIVDGEPVPGPEAPSRRRRRTVEPSRPRRVARAGSAHPRLEDRRDPVAGEQQG